MNNIMEIGNEIISKKKIYFSETWVGIPKGIKGKIINSHDKFGNTNRWVVKFECDDEPVIVFENEIKQNLKTI